MVIGQECRKSSGNFIASVRGVISLDAARQRASGGWLVAAAALSSE